MATSTLTSKGQITIPKEVRDALKLRTGHQVEFHIDAGGNVFLRRRDKDVSELRGIIRSRRKRPVTVEEMNEAIARGFSNT